MQAKDIMTRDPACCTPDTKLHDVARLMVEHDCGEIPVVKSNSDCGIVAQADLAMHSDLGETGRMVGKVSQPSAQASQVR